MDTLAMPADTRVSTPANNEAGDLLEHWQGVYLVALRITNDTHAAEDIAQETYLKAIAESRKRAPDNPRTWLFCIAANLARNWQRDKHTHQRLETGMKTMNATIEQPANDEALALRERFKNLDESYRLALSLHYEQGLTFREVAKVIGKPEGTASSLITRGLDALRQALARDGHTIAPAIIVAELQNLGGATLARPEVLTAIKAALLAKSGAGAALGAGAGAGAKAAAGISSVLLAGGVVIATVAIGLGIDHHFRVGPPPLPAAAPAVAGPVQPAPGGNENDPSKPAPANGYFDSNMKFEVFAEDGRTSLGHTPYWNERGIRVPSNGLWCVDPGPLPKNPGDLIAEIRDKHIPGLSLNETEVGAAELQQLAAAPDLRMLRLKVHDEIGKEFQAFTKLEKLSLSGQSVTVATLSNLRAPDLTSLQIGYTAINDAGVALLSVRQELKELSIDNSSVTHNCLFNLPRELRTLDVRDTSITDQDIIDRAAKLPPTLRKLSIGKCDENLTNLQKVRQALPKVRVNGWESYQDELAKKRVSLDQEEKEILAKLADATPGADLGIPADPEMHDVLNDRKYTLDMVDMPLGQAVDMIAAHAETRMVIDPKTESSAVPNMNLRVASMGCELHLKWVLRLADLDYRIYGRIVVIGKHAPIPAKTRTYALPVPAGETPWSADETQALAELLKTWPVNGFDSPDGYQFLGLQPEASQALESGKIAITAGTLNGVDDFLDGFVNVPPLPAIPAGYRELEGRLNQKAELKPEKLMLATALAQFRKAAKLNIIIDPKLQASTSVSNFKLTEPWPKADAKVSDALVDLCAHLQLRIYPYDDAISLQGEHFTGMASYPVVLDLNPALKRGVDLKELRTRLSDLLKEPSVLDPQYPWKNTLIGAVIRGRWLAQTDPWTAHRAAAIVEAAAKTGKVPAAPPAPWFFATFKNSGKPPVTPAAPDRSPGDQDGF